MPPECIAHDRAFSLYPRFLWLAGLVLIAGCATRPPVSEPVSEALWLAHRSALEALTHWQVQGRVAVRTDEEGWSAHFDWLQSGEEYRIRLRGPFGQGAVELSGNGLGVWLKRADQAAVFALDPETLLERETGWRLPVNGLSSWLRGLPVPGSGHQIQWDEQGRLLQMAQHGWFIDYRRYQAWGQLQLPDKLRLKRDSIQVRFVIDDWQTS